MKTLDNILAQERGEAGVDEVAVVERIVLEEHDVGCKKGILQPGNRGWCILPSFFLHYAFVIA